MYKELGFHPISSGLGMLEAMGRVAHKGGGSSGGASGKVSWPKYLQQQHETWLNDNDGKDMACAIDAAYNGSPYIGFTVYNPAEELDASQTQLDSFISEIPADPTVDWGADVDAAVTKTGSLAILGDAEVAAMVAAFSSEQQTQLQLAMGRMAAGMADAGADMSSAFQFALAKMQMDHLREVAKVTVQLVEKNRGEKIEFIKEGIGKLGEGRLNRLEAMKAATHLQAEINRVRIVAEKEYDDSRLNILVRDATWNMEIFTYADNLLASISGASPMGGTATQAKNSDGFSQIGGALTGAAGGWVTGAALAPATGGLSLLIPALTAGLGGAAGFLGG